MDKDENSLTELNRELITIFSKKKILALTFICIDLNQININLTLEKYNITHYLNFAAVKHVRSEDEIFSAKYLFNTNSENFLKLQKIKKLNLKVVFSISTDKVVEPSSFLGISKKLMEDKLFKFKKINKNIFVSTTRFANVSFSKGSILKSAYDRINQKRIFGIPKKVKRYFITHEEAVNLCLLSLLKEADGKIVTPRLNLLEPSLDIEKIIIRLLKFFKFKITKFRKKHLKNKNFYVHQSVNNLSGQKLYEKLYEDYEKYITDLNRNIIYINPILLKFDVDTFIKKINKSNNLNDIKKLIKLSIKNYRYFKNTIKIKNLL